MKTIAFDLEGPLSPNDNAYELMGLFPGGREVFEAVSRYDDLLTLEGRPGYEPGDTLALMERFWRHPVRLDGQGATRYHSHSERPEQKLLSTGC